MQSNMSRCSLTVALLALLAPGVGAARRVSDPQPIEDTKKDMKAKADEITDKWNQMDTVLETLFVIACQWKNSKDVHGEAHEIAEQGDKSKAEYDAALASTQSKNVATLKNACQGISGKQSVKCRQRCDKGWSAITHMQSRKDCMDQCVAAYDQFKGRCMTQADNLASVYDLKNKQAEQRTLCLEAACKPFPDVWVAKASKMEDKVKKHCKGYCKDDAVKNRCTQKFNNVEYDTAFVKAKSECSKDKDKVKDKKVSECADKKVKKKLEEYLGKCKDKEGGDGCKDLCKERCDVSKVDSCNSNAEGSDDVTKSFCTDFWSLMHKSSEVDPTTGAPIVLLSKPSQVVKK